MMGRLFDGVHRFDGDPIRGSTLILHMEESIIGITEARSIFRWSI